MRSDVILNAPFALAWGLNIRQAILYSWLASSSLTWPTETHNGMEFSLINKDELLEVIKPTYQSHSGLQGALLKMQSLNLMRIGKDKERYAICLNNDLLHQWLLAHSALRGGADGKA